MGNTSNKTCVKRDLARELAEYQITASPLNPEFRFEEILSEVNECRIVKTNSRRQVYHLQTPARGYFLKRSTLVRAKDRLRHFILPRRRWAEWRNLHRLRHAQIPAARPLSKGLLKIRHPRSYFVLTEQVLGAHIPMNSFENAQSLGQYTAFLHRRKVYHADLNRHNIILTAQGQFFLIDVQEVFFLPGMPYRLRIHNLGRILFNFCTLSEPEQWAAELLKGYHKVYRQRLSLRAVIRTARLHQQRRYRSRSKRCCKNSTEFAVVKSEYWKGYRRKIFQWRPMELHEALEKGQPIKGTHVISYRDVCIKSYPRRWFHSDRCRISWKMSRALEVRGIAVPRSLGYFVINNLSCFLAELLADRCHLNTYLSALSNEQVKRKALKKLALWLRHFHDSNVWQRDFKSSNILCQNGDYFMVDLDGVRIRSVSEHNKIYNLAQLNASLSNAVTIKDRLRFFYYYSANRQLTKPQRRAVYRKVWHITMTKNTALYDFFPEKLGL